MSGFVYRGRHCTGTPEDITMSRTHTNDLPRDETETGRPLQTHSLREFEKHLTDLKKENFSLKLRIYFLEERIQGKCEDGGSEDLHKINIELKVRVESLKQELLEKQQQLDRALTIETRNNQHGAEAQRHCEEGQDEFSHIQEVLENKIRLLKEEAELARKEADKRLSLSASESQRCVDLENRMMVMEETKETQEEMLAEKDRLIQALREDLIHNEVEVTSLHEERDSLSHRVTQLEEEMQELTTSLQQKEKDVKILREEVEFQNSLKQLEMQKLIAEQQVQLVQYENATGQCVSELQKAQLQVQTLQMKFRESEGHNKELQQRLGDMECELMSFQETARGQERTVQTLRDSLNTKDNEIVDLQQLIQQHKHIYTKQLQKRQMSTTAPSPMQDELLELQASLFSTQLELQGVQRTQRQTQRREDELARANQRLLSDLQGVQNQHQECEQHNQELLVALQRSRSDLQQMEEKWKDGDGDKEREVEERERTIRELKIKLQHKEHLLHDYTELLDGQKEPGGTRDVLIHKLRLRIQERERALERAVDERFICVEQKEVEVHKLQLLLREKERDMQKLRCVLSNNEETITSLEMLLRGKCVELEQVCEAWRGRQRVQQECEDRHNCSVRERDTLISQLQTTLHTHTQQTQEVTAALLSKTPLSSGEVVEKLKAQLQVKERLFHELLAEHSRQTREHHTHVQELLNALHTREQVIKDSAQHAGQVMSTQAARLQELRKQVASTRSRLQSTPEPAEDTQLLRDELQLVLAREREAQRELSVLRDTLVNNQEEVQTKSTHLNTTKLEHPVSMETEQAASSHPDTGDFTSDIEEEEDDGHSEFTETTEEEEHSKVTVQVLSNTQSYEQHRRPLLSQTPTEVEGQRLAEVKQLVEQKHAVERELKELKAQLEKAGFNSFSQMRKALLSLRLENDELRCATVRMSEVEEETHRLSEEQRGRGVQWQPQACEGRRRSSGVLSLDRGVQLSHSTQKLQDRLTVSRSITQAPAERLSDDRDQPMEMPVMQNSKQVQVDLQDLGYETCGRSENEAERDDTSSPEFDDLELCTSLSYRDGAPQWWSGPGLKDRAGSDVASLQQQVEDLQVQLSRSQALVLSLQDQTPNSTPRKSNGDDRDLRELVTRVSSLEERLRKDKGRLVEEEDNSTIRAGKFDTLIQAQARELSHLRQRMREGRSVCHILTQHLGDTTKSFEELLRANDIDYYMSQSFRDQLAQNSALAQRVSDKISSRDYSETADDRTGHELLAIRFSKELQQKDKLIESLRSKLDLQQHAPSPARSRFLSGDAEEAEHEAFGMDEQDSTNEDLDLCSELDSISELCQDQLINESPPPAPSHPYTSNPPSVTSSHSHQSSKSCHSMHCTPQRLIDDQTQTELSSAPLTQSPQFLSAQMTFSPFHPQKHPRPRSSTTGGFCLAEVHQELQRLQRQLAHSFSGAQVKPLPGMLHQTDRTDFSQHAFEQSPFAGLHASPTMRYGAPQTRENVYLGVSSSSSGYQSGARRTGTDLMEEHLREIRSLHQRLEDSIHTNECLRQQLEERLDSKIQDGGAPTNIYIQGLDSFSLLSNEVGVLKEENQVLQSQLQQASRDGLRHTEQLRDAVLLEHTRLKQAEQEAEKWAGQFRQLQLQMQEQMQVVVQMKQDKQVSQENANRLQHEVNVLQQQLGESRRMVQSLQCELQTYPRSRGTTRSDSEGRCQEGGVPDSSFASSSGSYVLGYWDDFDAVQHQLMKGKVLVCKMEEDLRSGVEINLQESCDSDLLTCTNTLKQILEEVGSVLRTFWRTALPKTDTSTPQHQKEKALREEVTSLRHKLAEQEETLRDTLESLRKSSCTQDSMEQFIFTQLSRTRDVLKKARTNLEKNDMKINSLGCSLSSVFPQSFSFTPPRGARGEISHTGFSACPGPSIVTALGRHPSTRVSRVSQCFGMQRPLPTFTGSTEPTLPVASPTQC